MFVESILKQKGSNVVAVDPEATAVEVAQIFAENKIGFAIVRDETGQIIGTVTERDIVQNMSTQGEKTATTLVKDFMSSNIVTCKSKDTMPKVMSLMTVQRTRHILVMDDGELAGIVSIGDVVKCRLEESMMDEESLREYVSGMGYT